MKAKKYDKIYKNYQLGHSPWWEEQSPNLVESSYLFNFSPYPSTCCEPLRETQCDPWEL